MTKQCTTQESRTEAIELCHYILDSDGHTQCVVKFACNPIDAFVVSASGRKKKDEGEL